MKIVVIVRTKNEEKNIGMFLKAYRWADEVIIADGGSTDETLEVIRSHENARLYHFPEKVWSADGEVWGNPPNKHINFLIERAKAHKADWIIFDDCDCFPNFYLKRDGRVLLEQCKNDVVMVNRIYVYGKDKYFEGMTKPDGTFTPSLWAWRAKVDVHANDAGGDWDFGMSIPGEIHNLWPPYALLHYFYPSDEEYSKKLDFYRKVIPNIRDPKEWGGRIIPLPEWAVMDEPLK